MNPEAYFEKASARRLESASAASSDAAEQACLNTKIKASLTADAISRDVVGEWLLSLAGGKRPGFSFT